MYIVKVYGYNLYENARYNDNGCTVLDNLGQLDFIGLVLLVSRTAQGGQGKYNHCHYWAHFHKDYVT